LTGLEATTYGVTLMEKPKDYYLLLGVARDASPATIERAYKRLARRLRPGVAPGTSREAFSDLQAAYETLADAERRRRYDESLAPEDDRLSSLAWSFVKSPALGDLRRPVLPASLSGEILLSAREAQAGGVLPVEVPIESECPDCDRTGGFVFDCPSCSGEGKVQRRLPVPVRIPAGVRDGTTFQVRVDEAALLSIFLTIHVHPA
jgi:DnaJ-class molecular chaperone